MTDRLTAILERAQFIQEIRDHQKIEPWAGLLWEMDFSQFDNAVPVTPVRITDEGTPF